MWCAALCICLRRFPLLNWLVLLSRTAPDPPPLAADGVESEWEARCSRFLSRCHGIDFFLAAGRLLANQRECAHSYWVNQSFLCAAQRDFSHWRPQSIMCAYTFVDEKELRLLTHLNLIEFGSTAD
jgi:hypothetical protein